MLRAGGFEPPASCVSSDACLFTVVQDITARSVLSSTYGPLLFSSFRPVPGLSGAHVYPMFARIGQAHPGDGTEAGCLLSPRAILPTSFP